jgi:acetyltransferase-like isoleucine patch superfamily enzyme
MASIMTDSRLISTGMNSIINRLLHKLAFFGPGGYRFRPHIHRLRGAVIGNNVWISQFVYIDELHPEAITMEDNVSIGLRTSIFTHFYWGPRRPTSEGAGPVYIERDVFIGPHCVILPNVRIGEGSVIQAGTVVTQNVPKNICWGNVKSGPIAKATIPLTNKTSYKGFARGLRPIRKNKRFN